MSKPNILIIYGGGGSEHEISKISCQYIYKLLKPQTDYEFHLIELTKDKSLIGDDGVSFKINTSRGSNYLESVNDANSSISIDYVIPYMHGYPSETGDIQSYLEIKNIPYWGASSEAHRTCFNKVLTKLVLEEYGIPTTPAIFLHRSQMGQEKVKAKIDAFSKKHGDLFIKASSQGSSVGCFPLEQKNISSLDNVLDKAFKFGDQVIIEKMLVARELEIAVYESGSKIHCSYPGEICVPGGFYDYDQKYNSKSKAQTHIKSANLSDDNVNQLKYYAKLAFEVISLKKLARIDFFLDKNNNIYLNEINTMPGMTPISMFPKMVEANQHHVIDLFLEDLKEVFK